MPAKGLLAANCRVTIHAIGCGVCSSWLAFWHDKILNPTLRVVMFIFANWPGGADRQPHLDRQELAKCIGASGMFGRFVLPLQSWLNFLDIAL